VIEAKKIISGELSLFAFVVHELITLNNDPTGWLDVASQTVGHIFRVINNKSEQA
jgi:hypothetical protein